MANNLLSVINGKIQIRNDAYGKVDTFTPFICRADKKIMCSLVGVTKFKASLKFTDISEIKFSVSKYIINSSTQKQELNPSYKYLNSFYGILIPELGQYGYFRINEEPTIIAENTKHESKSFTAYSGESVLQYEHLTGFYINQGTASSLEMYDENISSTGLPNKKIQLYNSDNTKLSLLNLILADDYYGWSIGHVDESITTLMRAFSVSNSQNVYSFLTKDVAQAFRCIFDFDTINNIINVYSIEDYGQNTNIYLSFERFVQEVEVKQNNSEIYTVFNVKGDNNLDISYVNFGSNKIVNIDYPLYITDYNIYKTYKLYEKYRESLRQDYKNLIIDYNHQQQLLSAIMDRQPKDSINNNWSSTVYYSLENLQTDLEMFKSAVELIEQLYTDENGVINLEDLNKSTDASLYNSYKYVNIPNIENEIKYRNGIIGKREESVNSDIVWEMYGLNDLILKRQTYIELVDTLAVSGYTVPWDSSKTISEETWNAHYQEWQDYQKYIIELNNLIDKKTEQVNSIKEKINEDSEGIKDIANRASVDYYYANYNNSLEDSVNYPKIIKALYKESDYVDSNYLITDTDDTLAIINESEQLFQAAQKRLEIESRPQLIWKVDTDSLYATKDFECLRNSLQLGDFVNLIYDTENVANRFDENVINMESDDSFYVEDETDYITVENNTFIGENYKFRVSEIEFNCIDFSNFSITFSDVIKSRAGSSDIETILNSFISSRSNQIKVDASSKASSIASEVAASLIKPYLQVTNAALENAQITNAQIEDLEAINASVETLLANYIKAEELSAKIANIDSLTSDSAFIKNLETMIISADKATIFDLLAGNITADKSITLVSKEGSGSIILENATMKYLDADGYLRMAVGYDSDDKYDIKIYSAVKKDGSQDLLWDTETGVQSGAIADNLIETNMIGDSAVTSEKINWSGIAQSVSDDGTPIFNSSQVIIDGEGLDTQWSTLQSEVAGISITASNQVFLSNDDGATYSPDTIILTPNAKLISESRLLWYYKDFDDDSSDWIQVRAKSVNPNCYVDDDKKLIVSNNFSVFSNTNSIVFKCAANSVSTGLEEYSDTLTVMKLTNGINGENSVSVVMSNETQTIATDDDNYPVEDFSFSTRISAFLGTKKLKPVLPESVLSDGQFKIANATCEDSGISLDFNTVAGVIDFTTSKDKQIYNNGSINLTLEIYGINDNIGKVIWYSSSIRGESGVDGRDAVLLRIDSSRGTVFKNNAVNTILSVIIYKGTDRIENSTQLSSVFGSNARLEWEWLRLDDETYGTISSSDSRLSDNGFHLTLSPEDVDVKVTFRCNLIE